MNAVNLLPTKHRPRTPTGGQQGSSYIVIGVLGTLLLMVLLYALTVNGINDKKASVTRTKAETAQAQKRAAELAPYGNFIQVKEQRVASVKSLATGRIDWERLALGLAHVLPQDVWLLNASASASGESASGGGGGGASAPPAPASPPPAPGGGAGAAPAAPAAPAGDPPAAPKMILKGCARDHNLIAVTLVRLRHLPAVSDVELVSASKPAETEAEAPSAGAPPAPSADAGGAAGGDDCGPIDKESTITFEATVTFKPNPGSDPQAAQAQKPKVPTSLGGGA